MSSKSAVKLLVPKEGEAGAERQLFKWVAILTGSKNTLKGAGFLLGRKSSQNSHNSFSSG